MCIVLVFQSFMDQSIDGSALLMLREEHLIRNLKMKLGSVLKFKAALAAKVGSCPVCLHCIRCHLPRNKQANNNAKSTTDGGTGSKTTTTTSGIGNDAVVAQSTATSQTLTAATIDTENPTLQTQETNLIPQVEAE